MNKTPQVWIAVALLLVLAFAGLFAVAMTMPLNHDEQQFVTAGALVGGEGLLPYRDFAYFHTPILPFVYAALFHLTDHLLLAGRAFSVALTWLAALALLGAAWRILSGWELPLRRMLTLSAALAFICNPLTVYVSWKAWNHSIPLLCLMLAMIASWLAISQKRNAWFAVSGLLVTVAAGTRISYAPLALPILLLAAFAMQGSIFQRLVRVAWCGSGMLLGAIPSLAVIAQAPQAFLFDNFTYNSTVNATFRSVVEQRNSLGLQKVLFFLRMVIQPATLALLLMTGWLLYRLRKDRIRLPYLFWSSLLLLPFTLIGALAASPSYSQYYSPVVPVLMLGVLGGMSALPVKWHKGAALGFAVVVVAAVISSIGYVGKLPALFFPAGWMPVLLHEEGVALRQHVPADGRIITVAPILPLEGGLAVYPELAAGPFGWRTAPFISPKNKKRYFIAGLADLPALTAKMPAAGYYIGYERKHEDEIADFAESLGYRKVNLGKKKAIWIPAPLPR